MGRKRKDACSDILNKGETSNACTSMTTITDQATLHLPPENLYAVEITTMNVENKLQPNISNKKSSSVRNTVVRRSSRLTHTALASTSQHIKPYVEAVINLVESENEEASPHCEQVNVLPILSEKDLDRETPQAPQASSVPVVKERKLYEKVDHILEVVDEIKSKVNNEKTNEGPSTDLSYKSLYVDSQKKVEALVENKFELEKELEYARGKIEAYEKMLVVQERK